MIFPQKKAPLIGNFCCGWLPVDPHMICLFCALVHLLLEWTILSHTKTVLSCLGLTKAQDVKMGKTIILLICTTGYVYMDIWTCVYSFQCSGIDLHLHSFFPGTYRLSAKRLFRWVMQIIFGCCWILLGHPNLQRPPLQDLDHHYQCKGW